MQKINLQDKFTLFEEHWSPKIVGTVNDCHIKLAKLEGEFVWHKHEHEDELFMVVKGRLLMKLRDGDVWLEEGELFIVPRNVEHLPAAEEETWVMLVEPISTLNTGNVTSERTVERLDEI
jgi:mannose-6-phosphate isomerase-like protein (cupin superfamily)